MLLWIIFAVLTAAVVATVLWPILFARREAPASAGYDTAIYRDQLEEIDTDLSRGLIAEAEAEAARAEISRRLLAAAETAARTGASDDAGSGQKPAPMLTTAFAVLLIPALSVALYLSLGSPGLQDQPLAARLADPHGSQDIATLVKKVEARLRQNPEEATGWDVIAPVYLKLRRFDDAANAYNHALRLLGENTNRLMGVGEALVFANDGVVGEKARSVFRKALARDASLLKARFWLATAEEQDGRLDEAAKAFRAMLAQGPADAPWRAMVEQRLRLVEGKRGGSPAAQPAPSRPGEPGPSREQVAAARDMSAGDRAAMINQMVEGLANRLKQDGNDLKGWLRLVRAYTVLGKREQAADALKSARKNFQDNDAALKELSALAGNLGL
ncbi:MAG: c-type cytochrome biogenesis protein CcmI [Hyphomicrobiales bacterium]|nr:c-type cytochrome biogenesis protein CcmI [Hyphomicrobiales bacterium]